MSSQVSVKIKSFGTAPVFFTALTTLFGAILFLRFGYAVGMLGFMGTLGVILLGHLITVPAALAISELASNQRVEGGGEYFIISRSFGLNIGATIGLALYLAQAISVAFYVIAFTEAFSPVLNTLNLSPEWTRRVVSMPVMLLLTWFILKKGMAPGIKLLYVVAAILGVSLVMFFLGNTGYSESNPVALFSVKTGNLKESFFTVFAILFPAFTGITAGVGLSGDLKNPGKSILMGTTLAALFGILVFSLVTYKLAVSASPDDLVNDQLMMSKIAKAGSFMVPIGLAAATLSSAIGFMLVAPRTLQALALDDSLPIKKLNRRMAKGIGKTLEPKAATRITGILALLFVYKGGVDFVAQVLSMLFMVTYGSICLISFLYHFSADPSYRPVFQTRWPLSLAGFLGSVWLMFAMQPFYALLAVIALVLLYIITSYFHRARGGMSAIFQGAVFQLSRNLQVYMQRKRKVQDSDRWRPSVVCVSTRTFENKKALQLLGWISMRYGFGTYIHLVEKKYTAESNDETESILPRLIELTGEDNNTYMDTLISPSFTSAVAQIVQFPGVSGMPNNLILFEFDKTRPETVLPVIENIPMAKAARLDVAVLATDMKPTRHKKGIHVWIRSIDSENSNLMILLSYIILGHPHWHKHKIRIFCLTPKDSNEEENKQKLSELILSGRLPISPKSIEMVPVEENQSIKRLVGTKSSEAGLTMVGFFDEHLNFDRNLFLDYNDIGDVLFVNASKFRAIR